MDRWHGDVVDSGPRGQYAERDWARWLSKYAARYIASSAHLKEPFSEAHAAFWDWVWDLKSDARPRPLVACQSRDTGKALALDTPIPVPGGWKTMGEMRVGDQVFDHKGQAVDVVAVSGVFERPTYVVCFDNGECIEAADDHQWVVLDVDGLARFFALDVEDWVLDERIGAKTVTTEQLYDMDYVFVPAVDWQYPGPEDLLYHQVSCVARGRRAEVQCITVGSKAGMFLAGREMIPTHNSTMSEIATVRVASTGTRRYGLYICGAQAQADDHVGNVAALLEGSELARDFPSLCERAVGQYGQSKGWRVNRLRTASGFTLDAIGLDKAVRGARLEEQRPDFIVLDDVDAHDDSPRMVGKKIDLITRSIIPAGDRRTLAVVFVQNMVHDDSVMARIFDGRADYMQDALLSGPWPALRDLQYEQKPDGIHLTGGTSTWDGLTLEMCQTIVRQIGLAAFLAEYQHERGRRNGALWTRELIDQYRVPMAPELVRVVVGLDPATTRSREGSQSGVVAAGVDRHGHYFPLRDRSGYYSPAEWAAEAIALWSEYGRSGPIIAEANQGGEMVRQTIASLNPEVPVELVKASVGKILRAEPVVAMYEQGRVHHVGHLRLLEEQMCTPYDPESLDTTFDRVDALVWSLMSLEHGPRPQRYFNPGRHIHHPQERARPAFVHVNPARVQEWQEMIAKSDRVMCGPLEYGALRSLLVESVQQYAKAHDLRAKTALESLAELDREYGAGKGLPVPRVPDVMELNTDVAKLN